MSKRIFTIEEINEIIKLYIIDEIGLSVIGNKFGVGRRVITRILKEFNIELRKSGRPDKGGKTNSNKKYKENEINKEKQRAYMKNYHPTYYEINKEKKKEYHRKYKETRNNTHRLKYSTDTIYKLKSNIRSMISNSFKKYGKKSKTQDILGCSFEEFKNHLESKFEDWMSWDNHGNPKDNIFELNKTWDIDHIIPLSSAKTEEDVINLNHFTNFQPLCSYTNRFIKRNSSM